MVILMIMTDVVGIGLDTFPTLDDSDTDYNGEIAICPVVGVE